MDINTLILIGFSGLVTMLYSVAARKWDLFNVALIITFCAVFATALKFL